MRRGQNFAIHSISPDAGEQGNIIAAICDKNCKIVTPEVSIIMNSKSTRKDTDVIFIDHNRFHVVDILEYSRFIRMNC